MLSVFMAAVAAPAVAAQSADLKIAGASTPEGAQRHRESEAARQAVPVGQRIPDFTLTDQVGQRVTLSNLSGKVVALTFGYVRCPNPAYCFRLASNLGQLQKQLKDRVGRDLILLTIVLDPEHDQRQPLLDYARVWTAEPQAWHFLTRSGAGRQASGSGFLASNSGKTRARSFTR